jgi:putative hydrolase of the HAD superfamily
VAIKAIIFDCFGVLVVSGTESMKHDFPQLSQQLHDLTLRSDYGYMSRSEFDDAISELTGVPHDEVEARYWQQNVRSESVFKWVRRLKNEGTYKIGLLSNIGKEWLDDFLPTDERGTLFDGEVLSGVVGIVKPDVRIFEMMAEKLGVQSEECVMIDDILENVEGAKRAGMETVFFGTLEQAQSDLQEVLTSRA